MGYQYSWWRYLNKNERGYTFSMAIRQLNKIKIPTLIITAEYDLPLCKDLGDLMVKNIPNAKLISIKKAGI